MPPRACVKLIRATRERSFLKKDTESSRQLVPASCSVRSRMREVPGLYLPDEGGGLPRGQVVRVRPPGTVRTMLPLIYPPQQVYCGWSLGLSTCLSSRSCRPRAGEAENPSWQPWYGVGQPALHVHPSLIAVHDLQATANVEWRESCIPSSCPCRHAAARVLKY